MPHPLIAIARDAITAWVGGDPYTPPALDPPWRDARPVFVSLHSPDGALRGCIGHLHRTQHDLAHEVSTTAVMAASQDPRFHPLQADELEDLDIEISILEPTVPVHDMSELDPKRYGVVVHFGRRRGVLLPDLEGVDTAEEQLSITRRKAGIGPKEPIEVERFEVTKIR